MTIPDHDKDGDTMTALTRRLVALRIRLLSRLGDAGQGTLEYVGMIAVAAVLALAILQATDRVDLGGFFTDQVDKIKDYG
jgi:hypothetical protein